MVVEGPLREDRVGRVGQHQPQIDVLEASLEVRPWAPDLLVYSVYTLVVCWTTCHEVGTYNTGIAVDCMPEGGSATLGGKWSCTECKSFCVPYIA